MVEIKQAKEKRKEKVEVSLNYRESYLQDDFLIKKRCFKVLGRCLIIKSLNAKRRNLVQNQRDI